MLTNRLKVYLKSVIGCQQTGYVPGRFIATNLRKMYDIISMLDQQGECAILMAIDYWKCFDSIEHDSLYAALKLFNIGEYFISWVRMLYCNFEFCCINNGRWSTYYKQERGVHQGSALSGPLFLYVAEILATKIKQNKKIYGIRIGQHEEKISQYADNTNLWSVNSEESINAIIDELDCFYQSTGLRVNYEKTVLYKIGAQTNTYCI